MESGGKCSLKCRMEPSVKGIECHISKNRRLGHLTFEEWQAETRGIELDRGETAGVGTRELSS